MDEKVKERGLHSLVPRPFPVFFSKMCIIECHGDKAKTDAERERDTGN